MDKNVFRDINYGMYIVSTENGKNVGCTINTLTQITSENPTISISLNKDNYTNQSIKEKKKFAVAILTESVDKNIIATFGFKSSREIDKFVGFSYEYISEMPVLKEGICGYLICEVKEIIDVFSHDVFIAKVVDSKKINNEEAMTYKYYHEVIKGKTPKKAPSYIEEKVEDTTEVTWVCDTCGYVYKGELPKDFKCPICGMDSSHFKKQ